jgi:thioesterase domain-containing protein
MENNWQVIFRVFDIRSGEWIRDFTHENLSENDARSLWKKYNDDVSQYQWNDSNHRRILQVERIQTANEKNEELANSTSDMD